MAYRTRFIPALVLTFCLQALLTAQPPQPAPQLTVRLKATLTTPTSFIYQIAFSRDGNLIATSSDDYVVRIWDARTGELKARLSGEARDRWEQEKWYRNQPYSVRDDQPDVFVGHLRYELDHGAARLAISPDGRMLVTEKPKNTRNFFDWSEVLELWDITTGELKVTLEQIPHGSSRVYWSPDGKSMIIQGSGRTKSRLIDVATGRVKAKLPYGSCTADSWFGYDDDCNKFSFNLDGSVFLKEKNPIKLWSANTGQLLAELKSARLPLQFSPTDKTLFVTSSKDKKTALLWELVMK